ncbi:hypothetical protein D3C87_1225250 [compost metagenome]
MDVLPVDRSDEGPVQLVHQLMGDAIAGMLGLTDLLKAGRGFAVVLDHVAKQANGIENVLGRGLQEVEERLFAGNQSHGELGSFKCGFGRMSRGGRALQGLQQRLRLG